MGGLNADAAAVTDGHKGNSGWSTASMLAHAVLDEHLALLSGR